MKLHSVNTEKKKEWEKNKHQDVLLCFVGQDTHMLVVYYSHRIYDKYEY